MFSLSESLGYLYYLAKHVTFPKIYVGTIEAEIIATHENDDIVDRKVLQKKRKSMATNKRSDTISNTIHISIDNYYYCNVMQVTHGYYVIYSICSIKFNIFKTNLCKNLDP